jgi:two-component system, OmpR family, sensor histidine kinase CpxA
VRIFFRILITVWVVIFVAVAIVTSSPSSSLEEERGRQLPLTVLQDCARRAIELYDQAGQEALKRQSSECSGGRLISLAEPMTADLAGRPLSRHEINLIHGVQGGTDVALSMITDGTDVALRSTSRTSGTYIYLVHILLPNRTLRTVEFDRAVRLLILPGFFSLLISASFVRPITRLKRVAERLGTGDLKARVTTRLIRRKDEVGDLARVFNQMAERIESLVIGYRHFLAHASHELGSPLTRLNIALALARRKGGPALEVEHERILEEADKLSNLVQELLLLARLESGNELSRSQTVFDIAEIVRGCYEDASFEAQQIGKTVAIRTETGFQVRGYPDLFRRALDNVVRNALRFARDGGKVTIAYFPQGDSSSGIVQVEDDGPGVPPDQTEAIFEPFFTLPDASDKAAGGSGLGLAIARQAILANGGGISAHTLAGSGLTVVMTLPIA